MNIAIIGYGKMGKEIERLALEMRHNIVVIIDVDKQNASFSEFRGIVDVAIEFSIPSAAEFNIIKCLENGISVVTGTTGWTPNYEQIQALCDKNKTAFFKASNFVIGVNAFITITEKLAKIFEKYPTYKIKIEETHHIQKLDKPSGTAVTLAEVIINNNQRFSGWKLSENETQDENYITIKSERIGDVFGDHKIIWESPEDVIILQHSAKSRRGFAYGALMAAEFIKGKTGIYSMKDLLNI
ncbi:MAG TPA: 4-hydroxy-tetrahydrodipicolinate reductase [Bacteroidales bacterium]|jgi:4-hydroxy-tetrahydrodipicolinate reductase|nr:4-hydroxy-tetrahydrodipicolinate reductase [Bacteroidales bacterium]HPD23389.1 4-hydroxy-tetrahydrodipicolinate reductase [Bacteroidales bacterium]HRS99443.1 4-hydroxy-tetrahydrodipicolinate reductase [Bacteroidales bacterium]HRT80326.1 4-hydroxy-tetrahydrodipicolinate reductase [Bacteroidales bacterium]